MIAHPQGFIEVPFSKITSNTVIRLLPWGRIDGTLILEGEPGGNETIRVSTGVRSKASAARTSVYLQSLTDTQGHFRFDMIPPGEWQVEHDLFPWPSPLLTTLFTCSPETADAPEKAL